MSVSPDQPAHLPDFRRPPELGGTGRDLVWFIHDHDLEHELRYRPDPDSPNTHGFIEPAFPMTLQVYQKALENSQGRWQKLF